MGNRSAYRRCDSGRGEAAARGVFRQGRRTKLIGGARPDTNNVGLAADLRVRKALETWYPGYIDWWKTSGPELFQNAPVFLRTAVGVGSDNWAKFDFVRMPEYRWGILLAPQVEGRTIPFGAHKGEPAWQEVPGEYRAMLRRLLVIQGDTEPASVEQQRHLGATARRSTTCATCSR